VRSPPVAAEPRSILSADTGGGDVQAQVQAGTRIIFPQLAAGVAGTLEVQTILGLINYSGQPAAATLRFFASDGTPLVLTIENALEGESLGANSQFSVVLPVGGTYPFETIDADPLKVGWLQVDSDIPITGFILYSLYDESAGSSTLMSEVGVGPTPASKDVVIPAVRFMEEDAVDTSVAICNSSDQTAYIKATFTSNFGGTLEATIELGPRQHLAQFISQIFPGIDEEFIGFVRFVRVDAGGTPTSDLDMHVLALITEKGILTSIPATEPAP